MRGRRSALARLARCCGVLLEYVDSRGRRQRPDEESLRAVLAAMGVDASSDALAAAELARLERAREECPVDPVLLCREGVDVALRWRGSSRDALRWTAEIQTEDGSLHEENGSAGGLWRRPARLASLARLPSGYHRLRWRLRRQGGATVEAEQTLVVHPAGCAPVGQVLGEALPGFGLAANLYTLRSGRNWGIGNLGDLASLLDWAEQLGACFVAINPLHALGNRGDDVCPYYPVSRLFRNALYLDPVAAAEAIGTEAARRAVLAAETRATVERLRAAERIAYEDIERALRPVLEALHGEFRRGEQGPYRRYLEEEGPALDRFATFMALGDWLGADGRGRPRDARSWPQEYRRADTPAVARFAERHASAIDFYRFVQFELDRQLAAAASGDGAGGERPGILADLAVGSAPGGTEPWAWPESFSTAASVGAPPDPFCAEGQDWRLAPLLPGGLEREGWRFWRALLRRSLRHAVGLRIDHAMSLERLYWIPSGLPATRGVYVRYPRELLLGILAIESRRSGAFVVAEDLGTVPEGLRERLVEAGILRTQVLQFERDRRGRFHRAADYSARAMVAATTHDLPTLRQVWRGEAGAALRRRLTAEGLVSGEAQGFGEAQASGAAPGSGEVEMAAAVHRFLARTPAPLVAVALDDLGGETEPVNHPGTLATQSGSWRRKMRLSLEELRCDAGARAALGDLPARRGRRRRSRRG